MLPAGQRVLASAVAAAAAVLGISAVFFGGGFAPARLVWIGGGALLLAALAIGGMVSGLLPSSRPDRAASAFAGCLLALAVWAGLTTLWSVSPDRSWETTNRTLVYAAFALVGLALAPLLARLVERPGEALASSAALLLGLVLGWALLAKCVAGLYGDYGRLARLRAPLAYWNELALLAAVAVPLALRLAAGRTNRPATRAAGAVLLYGAVVTALLTYSRFGVALACLAAAAWVVLDADRVESLAAIVLSGGAGAAVFGVALALPGITSDGQPRSVRAHDGWVFALVLLAGAAVVAVLSVALARLEGVRPLDAQVRRRVERVVGALALVLALAGLVVAIVFAHRIWNDFTNPVTSQISSNPGRLASVNSSNRWRWWQEAWHAWTRHPFGGTGAGTFELTDELLRRSPLVTTEPHNVPLQFLSETGIVGFLLFLGAAAAAAAGLVRARARAAGAERAGVTALAIGVAAFGLHLVVDFDWNFVATCGPLLLAAGALLGLNASEAGAAVPVRHPLLALGGVLIALGGVYSLAAPWLAQRELATATTAADWKRAHSYDPLSTEALTDWAAYEDATGKVAHADQLYRQAVALEPHSSETWYALGAFYAGHGAWRDAYTALNNAYTYDRFGPAGRPCGLLDQARRKAFGYSPPSCRAGRRASSP